MAPVSIQSPRDNAKALFLVLPGWDGQVIGPIQRQDCQVGLMFFRQPILCEQRSWSCLLYIAQPYKVYYKNHKVPN
jgi:hypothetical protein